MYSISSSDILAVLPQLILLASSCFLITLQSVFKSPSVTLFKFFSLIGIAASFIACIYMPAGKHWSYHVINDRLSRLSMELSLLLSMFSLIHIYLIKDKACNKLEYISVNIFAILGMTALISANNILLIYVSLELMSLCLTSLVAFDTDNPVSIEAAIKYFILGSISSGILLFGISLIYGASGHTDLNIISNSIANTHNTAILNIYSLGFILVLVGMAFKLGAFPMHVWVADVYSGAPLYSIFLISSVSKLAIFCFIYRLLLLSISSGFLVTINYILIFIAVGSMFIGNIAAILQTNIRRILGYSAVANTGFFLLGIISALPDIHKHHSELVSAWFYLIVYITTIAIILSFFSIFTKDNKEIKTLEDLSGLGRQYPGYAILLSLMVFSLAGLPPMIGFVSKLLILKSLIAVGHVYLAIIAVALSVISTFYYLKIVRYIFFESSKNNCDTIIRLRYDSLFLISSAVLIFSVIFIQKIYQVIFNSI